MTITQEEKDRLENVAAYLFRQSEHAKDKLAQKAYDELTDLLDSGDLVITT